MNINQIYYGDNVSILKTFASESVDLIYIDPPFFSNRTHTKRHGKNVEIREFHDSFNGDLQEYLSFMRERIVELHRVLKSNGSMYLHCDWHSDAYLRILCDEIFQRDPRSVIIWKRSNPHFVSKTLDIITDTILYYTKSDDFTYTIQYSENMNYDKFDKIEVETNRKYTTIPMETEQNFKHVEETRIFYLFDGKKVKKKTNKGWRWSQKTIDERWKENPHLFYFTSNGKVRYKLYLDNYVGDRITNLWDDISNISSNDMERIQYPTQKPLKLLERIISSSSNEGDVILDAFCGSGTTFVASKNLNRKFIGIDASLTACIVSASRVKIPSEKIIGYTNTYEDVIKLNDMEFQNMIIRAIDPTLSNITTIKQNSDSYIELIYYGIFIAIKKSLIESKDIEYVKERMKRRKKKKAFIIGTQCDKKCDSNIHFFTLKEIFEEKKHTSLISNENTNNGKLF